MFVTPEAEVVVFGVAMAHLDKLVGDVERLSRRERVDVVVVKEGRGLHPSVEGDLVPIATEEKERTATDMLDGSAVEHGG